MQESIQIIPSQLLVAIVPSMTWTLTITSWMHPSIQPPRVGHPEDPPLHRLGFERIILIRNGQYPPHENHSTFDAAERLERATWPRFLKTAEWGPS